MDAAKVFVGVVHDFLPVDGPLAAPVRISQLGTEGNWQGQFS
jgi:hypothetical protein